MEKSMIVDSAPNSKKPKLSSPTPTMSANSIKYYQVDAFNDTPFKGNPAAVCLLYNNPSDDQYLQSLATEFNLPATCFLTHVNDRTFLLRCFTPLTELKLCGHGALASAHVLFAKNLVEGDTVEFHTHSGILTAKKYPFGGSNNERFDIEMNFPIEYTVKYDNVHDPSLIKAFSDANVVDVHMTVTSEDLLVVLPHGKDVQDFKPCFDAIEKCPGKAGVIVTGAVETETGFDFVSRYFCPKFGIPEDPATGSVHCALATYWSKKLGKTILNAYQASLRGGKMELRLDDAKERVWLLGRAIIVMEGTILV